jgi:hypothetical protein
LNPGFNVIFHLDLYVGARKTKSEKQRNRTAARDEHHNTWKGPSCADDGAMCHSKHGWMTRDVVKFTEQVVDMSVRQMVLLG